MLKRIVISGASQVQVETTAIKVRSLLISQSDILGVDGFSDFKYGVTRPNNVIYMGSIPLVLTKMVMEPCPFDIYEPKFMGEAAKHHGSCTHHIIIPYTIDGSYFVKDAVLQKVISILPHIPTVLLENKSKEDNWRLIVNFLSGIIV